MVLGCRNPGILWGRICKDRVRVGPVQRQSCEPKFPHAAWQQVSREAWFHWWDRKTAQVAGQAQQGKGDHSLDQTGGWLLLAASAQIVPVLECSKAYGIGSRPPMH